MVKGLNTTSMGINMTESMSMDFHRGLENILGVMAVILKETSSRGIGTDMEFGMMLLQIVKAIKAITCLIKSTVTAFMTGETDTSIKEILSKTNETVKGNYTITSSLLMMAIGNVDKDVIKMISKLSKVT
jgi:hypothetical protein